MSIFSKTKVDKPKTSTFDMSYDRKFSLNMGDLVPIHVQEIVPGDYIKMNTQQMLRFMPMVAPVMHEVNVFTHFFFVPNRIMWKNWEDFITGGRDGNKEPLFPTIAMGSEEANQLYVRPSSLADYLGLPRTDTPEMAGMDTEQVSALPFYAYQLIYDEYYRDQNMIESTLQRLLPDGLEDGIVQHQIVSGVLSKLHKRAWQHDYFTSALPWAQRGEAVRIPVFNDEGGNMPISFNPMGESIVRNMAGAPYTSGAHQLGNFAADGRLNLDTHTSGGADDTPVNLDNSKNLFLSPDDANPNLATVTDLRRAFKLQEWLEKVARTGARYTEVLKAFFGVTSSDARLQRPEFLGGSMSPVMISEVLQTSETTNTGTPLADMAGHGLNVGSGQGFSRFFEEHGYVIGLMSVMPKTSYQQGIPRHFSKFDKYDYFWPEFQHIGEQAILNKELFVNKDAGINSETFGYIPRYAEYKYNPSTVHGYMKSSLAFWHLGRIFDDTPPLSESFINCNPRNDIFAVEANDEDHLICHLFHNIKATRRMSYFGEPKF